MSDEQPKEGKLTPWQSQSLTRRSAALVRRGLAEALTFQSSEAYFIRGLAKYDDGDYNGAIDDFTKAIEINPRDAEAYFNRGVAKYYKGDYNGAIDDFTKVIETNPRYAEAYYGRGLANANIGDLDSAIADYNTAIEIDPSHAEAYNNRGLAWSYKGDHEEAIIDYAILTASRSERQAILDRAMADYNYAVGGVPGLVES